MYIAYTRSEGGDRRPLVCFEDTGEIINGFEITKQKGNKNYAQYRYELIDWKEAGCVVPSYVNLHPEDSKTLTKPDDIKYIGTLTERDQHGMNNKLQEIQKKFS
ncbi:hypothetical protein HCN83_17515 [Bacillus luteus]|uniref:Uncharacterized protein n=2 Tax=Alkalicoccus luteus TaxID=1237094 RepID=A0A969PU71_9BACI|nr:hypothetical protein [Alkalicoccus luteus]